VTFTYTNAPATDTTDAVRFLIGDTVSPGDLSDEEIAFLLTTYSDNVGRAAMAAVSALIAKFAKDVDKQVGDLRIFSSQKVRAYERARQYLESILNVYAPLEIYAGGLSYDEQESDDLDTDLPQSFFRRRMHDMPETSSPNEVT